MCRPVSSDTIYCGILVQGLHRGEQQHVPDRSGVGEQHHQPVQTEAQAAGGGKAVLQSGDIVIVHLAGIIGVLGLAGGYLALEALLLVDGVVELAEGVAELGGVDEILKPLGEGRLVGLALGQIGRASCRERV